MKQYKITSSDTIPDSPEDCYLSPDDPIQEIKRLQYLGGLGGEQRLAEYRQSQKTINNGSNISKTGTEKAQLARQHDIKPGTPEWFKLWFSRPYLTGEKPIGK